MWRRICPSVVEFAWLNISEWEIRELSNVYTEGTLRTATSRLQPWEQTGLKYRYLDLLKFQEACFSPSAIWRDTASKSKGKLPPLWSKSTRHHILTSKSSLQECRLHWEKACLRCARSSGSLYVYKLGLGVHTCNPSCRGGRGRIKSSMSFSATNRASGHPRLHEMLPQKNKVL